MLTKRSMHILVAIVAVLLALRADAGNEAILAKGFTPNATYQVSDFDAVNVFNGNLLMSVPIGQTYKTDGVLSYAFRLHYNSEFWRYRFRSGVSLVGDTIVVTGLNYRLTTSLDAPDSTSGGTEAFFDDNAGPGWNLNLGALGRENESSDALPSYVYRDPDGALHAFHAKMHGADRSGDPSASTLYTNDGTYLRMRLLADPNQREIDEPGGIVRRFRCVSKCDKPVEAVWNLEWIADQFGYVLLIDRRAGTEDGPVADLQPATGNWVWRLIEGRINNPDDQTRATPYYTPADYTYVFNNAIRKHYLTFDYQLGYQTRLRSVDLAGPQGQRSVYSLDYGAGAVSFPRAMVYPWTGTGLRIPYDGTTGLIKAHFLQAISLPDTDGAAGGKWKFAYYAGNESELPADLKYTYTVTGPSGGSFPTSRVAGHMRQAQSPAGGGYQYTYQRRAYPYIPCSRLRDAVVVSFAGVSSRQQIDENGTSVGDPWIYSGTTWLRTDGATCLQPVEFIAGTLQPPLNSVEKNGRLTVAYYNFDFMGAFFGAPFSPDRPHPGADGTSAAGSYLSEETYQVVYSDFREGADGMKLRNLFPEKYCKTCPAVAATKLRSKYVKYDESGYLCVDDDTGNCTQINLRQTYSHEHFADDVDAWTETISRDFDGLGHFRVQEQIGNFRNVSRPNDSTVPLDHRLEFTLYNPSAATGTSFNGSTIPVGAPAANDYRWFQLETFTRHLIGEAYEKKNGEEWFRISSSLHFFDPRTGFERAVRLLEPGVATITADPRNFAFPTGDKDFVKVFTRTSMPVDASGPYTVVQETDFGGDTSDAGSWTEGLPPSTSGNPDYAINTVYRFGTVAQTTYAPCDIPFLTTYTATVDKNTGLVLKDANVSGAQTSYGYDAQSRIKSVTPPGELEQTYQYSVVSGAGTNHVSVKRTGGPALDFDYDHLGRMTASSQTMPPRNATESSSTSKKGYQYNVDGSVWQETVPTFDKVENSTKRSWFTYDVLGRLRRVLRPDETDDNFTYKGAREIRTDTGSVSRWRWLNSFGAVAEVYDGVAHLQYEYGPFSNLALVTTFPDGDSGNKQKREFFYDGRRVLRTETHPELAGWTIAHPKFDSRGHSLLTRYVKSGSADQAFSVALQYDAAERLQFVYKPGSDVATGAPTHYWKRFDYYPAPCDSSCSGAEQGQLSRSERINYLVNPRRTDDGLTISVVNAMHYHSVSGRVSSVNTTSVANSAAGSPKPYALSMGGTTSYAWSNRGELTSISYPAVGGAAARTINQGFKFGYLSTVTDATAAKTLAAIVYAATGAEKTITFSNGLADEITPDSYGMNRPKRYDWKYRAPVTGIVNTLSTGDYTFDGLGNIRTVGDDSFTYDAASRLTSATVGGRSQSFKYDGFGNLWNVDDGVATETRSFTVDAATNRITAIGAPRCGSNCNVGYDTAGNVTSAPDLRNVEGTGFTFAFDAVGSMTALYAAAPAANLVKRQFVYDADDERVGTIDFAAADSIRELWSFRDLGKRVIRDVTREPGGTWNWTKDYVFRNGTLNSTYSTPLTSPALQDAHTDHLGTVRLLTNGNDGTIADGQRKYLPFGEPAVKTTLTTRLAFTGHERDDYGSGKAASDLDYMHARYYSAFLGRFLSVDPIKAGKVDRPQSWNAYAYVLNNPLRLVDADGAKDKPFNAATDKPITPQRGTATPLYFGSSLNPFAYNCHSYAWHDSKGDPSDPRNHDMPKKWDQFPDDDLKGYRQLKPDEPNAVGDRVIYYVDTNKNGKFDSDDKLSYPGLGVETSAIHSAIVTGVDAEGNTTEVTAKMGQAEISTNHPNAPTYYDEFGGHTTNRAYYRKEEPAPKKN